MTAIEILVHEHLIGFVYFAARYNLIWSFNTLIHCSNYSNKCSNINTKSLLQNNPFPYSNFYWILIAISVCVNDCQHVWFHFLLADVHQNRWPICCFSVNSHYLMWNWRVTPLSNVSLNTCCIVFGFANQCVVHELISLIFPFIYICCVSTDYSRLLQKFDLLVYTWSHCQILNGICCCQLAGPIDWYQSR